MIKMQKAPVITAAVTAAAAATIITAVAIISVLASTAALADASTAAAKNAGTPQSLQSWLGETFGALLNGMQNAIQGFAIYSESSSPKLTVTAEGNGHVSSSPSGILCGAACEESYSKGTEITLTAKADEGHSFERWSGACSGSQNTCTLVLDSDKSVNAKFSGQTTSTYKLTVQKSGTAYGTVKSDPFGIFCGSLCQIDYDKFQAGSTVTLTATSEAGVFDGWGGACSGTLPTCAVTMDAEKSVTAKFTAASAQPAQKKAVSEAGAVRQNNIRPQNQKVISAGASGRTANSQMAKLIVTQSGVLSTVTSSPEGIRCSSSKCEASFVRGATVTLTALENGSVSFKLWTGCPIEQQYNKSCTVKLDSESKTINAFFVSPEVSLKASIDGTGRGVIRSFPDGIVCGSDPNLCDNLFSIGGRVTFTADADTESYSVFTGWGGLCNASGACNIVVQRSGGEVKATFGRDVTKRRLLVNVSGKGSVVSSPGSLNCSSVGCAANFSADGNIVLIARPSDNAVFNGWSGACSGSALTCTVKVNSERVVKVIANFVKKEFVKLNVTQSGVKSVVVSVPEGIRCSSSKCEASFVRGSTVTLTASETGSVSFKLWTGCGIEQQYSKTCKLTMDKDATLNAYFVAPEIKLKASVAGNGKGVVQSDPYGLVCGFNDNRCDYLFSIGTKITVTANPDMESYSNFSGWTGACSGTQPICEITASKDAEIGAKFEKETGKRRLVVGVSGNGAVTSNIGKINCNSASCVSDFSKDGDVTLTAKPADDAVFAEWNGACSGAQPICSVKVNNQRVAKATANFAKKEFVKLTLTQSGVTSMVVSSPEGIRCSSSKCEATFVKGTPVALTARENPGAAFVLWTGCGIEQQYLKTCSLKPDKDILINAYFELTPTQKLQVSATGAGNGTIKSEPEGINCWKGGGTCTAAFNKEIPVKLTASADAKSTLYAWTGSCSGASTCTVQMDGAKTVTAKFSLPPPYKLSVTKTGTGKVNSEDGTISCGEACTATYQTEKTVTLTATPTGRGNRFSHWTGCDTVEGAKCILTLDDSKTVTAVFGFGGRKGEPRPVYG